MEKKVPYLYLKHVVTARLRLFCLGLAKGERGYFGPAARDFEILALALRRINSNIECFESPSINLVTVWNHQKHTK